MKATGYQPSVGLTVGSNPAQHIVGDRRAYGDGSGFGAMSQGIGAVLTAYEKEREEDMVTDITAAKNEYDKRMSDLLYSDNGLMRRELDGARGIGEEYEQSEKKIREECFGMVPKSKRAHVAFTKMVDAEASRNFSLVRDHSYKQRDAYKAVTFDNMVQLKSETVQKYYKNHELIGANLEDIRTNLYANYVTQKGEAWCESKFNQIEDDIIQKTIESAIANDDKEAAQDLLSAYGDRVEPSKLNSIRSNLINAEKQDAVITMAEQIAKDCEYDVTKIDEVMANVDSYGDVNEGGAYYLAKEYIADMQGTKYSWGGNDKNGIDCSGYTKNVMVKMGWTDIPRTADTQCKWAEDKGMFRPNDGSYQPKAGDLVFIVNTDPNNKNAYKNVTHVGFMDENGNLQQAGSSKGVGSVPMSTFEGKILGYATTGTKTSRMPMGAKEKEALRNKVYNNCVKQKQIEKARVEQTLEAIDDEMWKMSQAGITDPLAYQKVANRYANDKDVYRKAVATADSYTKPSGTGKLSSDEEAQLKDMIDCGEFGSVDKARDRLIQLGASPAEIRNLIDYYQNNEFKSYDWSAMKQRFKNVIGINDNYLWLGAKEAAKDFVRKYKADNDGRLPPEEDVLEAACNAGMKPKIAWYSSKNQYSLWERMGIRRAEMYNMKISKIDESSNGGYIVTYRDGTQQEYTEAEFDAKLEKVRMGERGE